MIITWETTNSQRTKPATQLRLLSCVYKNDVHTSLSRGMPTTLVLLDLSAAFDTIDHRVLLNCLSSWFGLGGVVLDWFSSYMAGRVQSVKVGDVLSQPADLSSGVPQGSVLGPILFSLYTTPLNKIISAYEKISYHIYPDDTQLYISLTPTNFPTAIATLQKCLTDV